MKKFLTVMLAVSFVAMASSAMALIDLNKTPTGAKNYATEISIPAAGTDLDVNDFVVAKVGFGSNETDVRYYRYDLNNDAAFASSPSLMILGALGPGSCTLSQTGSDDEFVIFTCSNLSYEQTNQAELDVADLTVQNQSSVTMKFAQYDSISNAQNQTNAIGSASGTILGFKSGMEFMACESPSEDTKLIDVTEGSLLFVGAPTNESGAGCITLGPVEDVLWTGGAQVVMSDMVDVDSKIEVSAAAFSATDENLSSDFGAYEKVSATVYELIVDQSSLLDDQIVVVVTGEDLITKGPVTAKYIPVAAADSDISTLGPILLTTFDKNGTSDRISFSLTPGGVYDYYVRITNPSSISGAVFLTVYNDAGDSSTFNLDEVAGVDGLVAGELPAGASTSLMTINAIFDAAQEADSAFDLANDSMKLRIDVEAEFGEVGGDEVIGNAFSVSTDGTTFNMVQ